MKEIKLFEKWVKRSLNEHFVFKSYEDFSIVTDGYVGFKISNKCKNYRRVIKEQTFQDLKEDFKIYNRKIEKIGVADIQKEFDISNKEKAIKMPFVYDNVYKARIFKNQEQLVFVKDDFLKNIDLYNYEIYAGDPLHPLVFYSKDVSYITLPIRMCDFQYEIKEIQGELKCN
ncbi:nitrate ABC transporter ATP-binding protein [Clostridium niameyense]|uniref:Nitrate ABC transporter ATP-binding protein n=1 Tax=Clostridium niameyense TaxID=1622073 RepID=A0A6M0RE20_9CLOT|nr:nitrate ABC transporter ATP-binding protein [Clostridium niameyense]NEZ47618.1 nitrate ABC transporter ATP-binding protein [Clostridium niameyense]